jgi:predicted permease
MSRRTPLAVGIYHALIVTLLPRAFRARHGSGMISTFADVHAAASERGAGWSALTSELPGLFTLALVERGLRRRPDELPLHREESMLAAFSQDLRYAVRSLRSAPGFALVAILSLGLGIGANTAIFSVVNGVLLKPLAVHAPDDLLLLGEQGSSPGVSNLNSTSIANYLAWKSRSRTLQIAAYGFNAGTLTGQGDPVRVQGSGVDAGFFGLLGVQPLIGRTFRETDTDPAGEASIVLSYPFWQQSFGGDSGIVGKLLMLNDRPRRVIGIMPRRFSYPAPAVQYWTPYRFSAEEKANHDQYFLQVLGRKHDGVSLAQVRADLAAIQSQLRTEWPAFNATLTIGAYPLIDSIVDSVRTQVLVLMGAVAFVLLITCANLGTLFLARAGARQRELAVRQALGAGTRRVAQQLMTESTLLALAGAVAAIGIGRLFLRMILAAQGALQLPRTNEITLDWRVLLFTLGIGLVAGLAFGLFPVFRLRGGKPYESLRAGSRGASAAGGGRSALVIAQLALSVVLLTGAGLLIRSFARLQRVDPGFNPRGLLSFSVAGSDSLFLRVASQRIRELPGVLSVGLTTQLPITGRGGGAWFNRIDRPVPAGQTPSGEADRVVTADFFTTLRIPVRKGRALEETDGPSSPGVVINEALAAKYYPGEDPIGKLVYLGTSTNRLFDHAAIVGVVADTRDAGMSVGSVPVVYMPLAFAPYIRSAAFVVRAEGDPLALVPSIRAAIRSIDAKAPVTQVNTMEDVVNDSFAPARWSTTLMTVFAAVALVTSVIGIFGVLSYIVAQRTRELGIRLALGATSARVQQLVLVRATVLIGVGIGLGLATAYGLTRLMRGLLFEVQPGDPLTFASVGMLLAALALLACYLPVRRATRIDPTIALRAE